MASSTGPSWRHRESPGSLAARSRMRRRVAIVVLSSLVLAALGIAGLLLYRLRPVAMPHFVTYCVAAYEDRRIPSAPMALADLRALRKGAYFRPATSGAD